MFHTDGNDRQNPLVPILATCLGGINVLCVPFTPGGANATSSILAAMMKIIQQTIPSTRK